MTQSLDLHDRFDAGDLDASAGRMEGVIGRVVAVDEEQVRIVPTQGPAVALQLDPGARITLEGTLVSAVAVEEGAQVRASFRTDEGRQVADEIELLPARDGQMAQ